MYLFPTRNRNEKLMIDDLMKNHPNEALERDLTLLQDAVLKHQSRWSGHSLSNLLKDQRKRVLPDTKCILEITVII